MDPIEGRTIISGRCSRAELTSNITRWRRGVAFIGLSAILSCTYGPEEQHHRIDHTTIDPQLKTIGVLVTHYSVRQPTGISTFPDGGSPKTVYRTTTLYFADKLSGGLREVASIAIPPSIQSAAASTFLGWRHDTAFFELRCQTGSDCGSHPARWIYRAPIDGSLERLDSSASPLASVPNVVWHWGDTVSFRANTHNIPVLALAPEGTLTVASPPGARPAAILGQWAGERWRLNANPTYGILRAPCRTVTIVGPLAADDSGTFRLRAVGQLSNAANTLDSLPAELTVTGHLSSATKPRTLRLVIAPAYNPPPRGPNWTDTLDVIEGRLRDITCP